MALPKYMEGMLSGVRVLDLTRVLAGPWGSLMLSDLGAEVIKIEQPDGGDTTRQTGVHPLPGLTSYFTSVNRNKLSMTCDLTKEEGREIFHELVGNADVVLNNYRPTVLEKLGCDAVALRKANQRIINCAISGFGQTGPYRDRPAYDLVVQGMGGGLDMTGYPDGEPAVMGLHIGDQAGGMFAAFSIAAALFHRERCGEGQDIDISLLDCQISLLAFLGQSYLFTDEVPQRTGTAHPVAAPLKAFKTRDGYITVVAHQNKPFETLCGIVGAEELLEDDRFSELNVRTANREALYAVLDAAFVKERSEHWLERLREAGIACGPVNNIGEALADPQVLSRNMVVDQSNRLGEYRVLGNPVKSSAQEDAQFGPPPQLGEHTDLVLRELLGKRDDDIAGLRQRGVI